MMRWFLAALLAVASLFDVAAPRAADGPLMTPAKDVTVSYRLDGSSRRDGSQKLRVTYADQGRVRLDFFQYVESSNSSDSLIFDPPANRVITVLPARHGYLERDVGTLNNPGQFLSPKMNFTRKGVVTIAGQSCTDWRVLNGSAEEGTACVTDDGLVLRATRNKPSEGAIVAIDVRYGPPSAGSFTPPPDFRLLLPVQKGTPPATGAKPP